MNSQDNSGLDIFCEDLTSLLKGDPSAVEVYDFYQTLATQNNSSFRDTIEVLEQHCHNDTVDQLIAKIVELHSDKAGVWVDALNFYNYVVKRIARGIPIAKAGIEYDSNRIAFYNFLAYAYKYTGDRDNVIHVLNKVYEKGLQPIFFQCVAEHELSDQVQSALIDEAIQQCVQLPSNASSDDLATPTSPPFAKTQGAQEIGTDSAVLSGCLSHTKHNSEYCFQYGTAADNLDKETVWHPVPPGYFSEVRDNTLSTFSSWLIYGSAHEFSVDPCSIHSLWPFAIDRNHLDGVGQITLLYGWRPSSLPPSDASLTHSRLHSLDLRGGAVSFKVRQSDMDPKGGDLVFSLGSSVMGGRIADDGSKTWAASQWMMTGEPMSCMNTSKGEWTKISFDIQADPQLWSYGSNNLEEQENSGRYKYLPLADMVERHNANLVMCQMFADDNDIPEGEITLREGRVVYRDWSMLRNGNGAELVAFPGEDLNAALKLTNGQYRNHADGWYRTQDDSTTPCKFVWRLPEGGQLDGVVLVQHPRYPVLMAQVFLRDGGPDGHVVHAGLVSLPEPSYDQPKRTYISIPDNISATHIEVNLMQGHNPEGLGLMGVEAFGKFSPKHTAIQPVTVCDDIYHLEPGCNLYYRLVYRDQSGLTEGEICKLKLPNDATPALHSMMPLKYDDRAWLLHGNAMGLSTTLQMRLDGELLSELPFGRTNYRRHTVVRIPEDKYTPGKTLEVLAKNKCGSSETMTLKLP